MSTNDHDRDIQPEPASNAAIREMDEILLDLAADLADEVEVYFIPAGLKRDDGVELVALQCASAKGRVLLFEDSRGRAWLVTQGKGSSHADLVELRTEDDARAQLERCRGIIDAPGAMRECSTVSH